MCALDLLKQRQVIKGDSTLMIRASPWLQFFPHLKSFQASGSCCYNWQHRQLYLLTYVHVGFPQARCPVWFLVMLCFLPSSPAPLHWKDNDISLLLSSWRPLCIFSCSGCLQITPWLWTCIVSLPRKAPPGRFMARSAQLCWYSGECWYLQSSIGWAAARAGRFFLSPSAPLPYNSTLVIPDW